jgi:hypothetical protein
MKRFLKKALRWVAILLATFIVLLLVFYAEEDWRGARDWAACQRDLAARGETLDLRQLVPPGKPEDDLSKVPIFAEMYQAQQDYEKTKKRFGELRIDQLSPGLGTYNTPKTASYFKGESIDLTAWQKFYRSTPKSKLPPKVGTPAQDVLQTLSQFDPQLTEIETALSNPNAYWPTNYEKPFDTYLGGITRMIPIARILQLKAVAHLDNHETDQAEKEYLLSFDLNQPLAQRCFLINYLVIVAVRTVDNAILWDGLHRHAWTDAQLREMDKALASESLLDLAPKAYRTERASSLQTMRFVQGQGPFVFRDTGMYEDGAIGCLCSTWYIRPSGWWNQDRRQYALGMQSLITAIDPSRGTLNPRASDTKERTICDMFYIPLTKIALPADFGAGPRIASAETYRRLARLACRLEEYRLAHNNQYPDSLNGLPDLPPHLNQEVLSEQPLQYHRKGDGYSLYSLGWNQKDDGGVYNTDPKEGDWPWPSP